MTIDLVKDLRQDLINKVKERYQMNDSEAERFVDNYPNESTWADVEATAEALDLDITDVEDDDVEEWLSTGGSDELETSMGNAVFKWDNITKTYVLYLALEPAANCNGIQVYNNITREMILDMKVGSLGSYYNDYLRGNESHEGCGCRQNCCESDDLDQIPSRYKDLFT